MEWYILLIMSCTISLASTWSIPYYPVPRAPQRITRFAPRPPIHLSPVQSESEEHQQQRPKRGHDDYDHDHHDHDRHRATSGVTGPVHTFVKTDKNANYKWGVRHHVGNKYAS